ncbi:MAG: cyclic nucleotide-binding domain-containing protein [Nannocystaceae bacterium]|nr:cyclic nucleotide-binding domain-containing protein [Nannocystaceae bacterium]
MSPPSHNPAATIPESAWRAPLLRELDELARQSLAAASRVRAVAPGATLWQEHDAADTIALVLEGSLELRCLRRGDAEPSRLRLAAPGDTVGEEALLGLPRRAAATALDAARVLEVPAALFLRGSDRSGAASVARECRVLQRQATRDLVRQQALGRTLPDDELDLVIDAVRWERFDRGAKLFAAGEPAAAAWLLCDGLVQLQTEDDDGVQVRAYLGRGDTVGDDEALAACARSVTAVALGAVVALRLPAATLRTVVDRNPGLREAFARVAEQRGALQQQVVGAAAAAATQHVFRDLYRMQMARSLLAIDQDTCVRCGHCAWTCAALHGESRLVRRGDKIVTRLPVLGQAPRSLLLPNSCQHCKNPACMIDCPTGAIGRDPHGEVFIREALCTGCGNCAKACPWENIRIAPRPAGARAVRSGGLARLSPEIATKCDLCRDYDEPGCVRTCPTGAILRLDPSRDVAEVAHVLGAATPGRARALRLPWAATFAVLTASGAIAAGLAALARHDAGVWVPASGPGLHAGIAAAIAMVVLVLHAAVKRNVRLWVHRARRGARREAAAGAPRSRVKPLAQLHVLLGLLAPPAVLAHAGLSLPDGPAGALMAAFWLATALGLWGALAYATLPARLTRLERDGALPEDLRRRRGELVDRLFRAGSGRSELVRAIADRVLVPYARRPLGAVALLASGRTLAQEEARVHVRIDAMLQGRGVDKLAGLDELVRVVVELRALPLRRLLTAMLRGFLPLHVLASASLLALLAVHVLVAVGR